MVSVMMFILITLLFMLVKTGDVTIDVNFKLRLVFQSCESKSQSAMTISICAANDITSRRKLSCMIEM